MSRGSAASIFEYLTAKNPDLVFEDPKDKSLSKNPRWYKPSHVRPWEEFNFQTMESIFGGKLMEECLRERFLPFPAPPLNPRIDCVESGEDSTVHILTRWTRAMVNEALREVEDIFNLVFWVPPSRANTRLASRLAEDTLSNCGSLEDTAEERGRPARRGLRQYRTLNRKRNLSQRPDGAGVFLSSRSRTNSRNNNINRLPSEIKPGSKWTSDSLRAGQLTEEDGRLRSRRNAGEDVQPIIQIYHYCILANTRYGFLITSKEIMVVRIKPLVRGPVKNNAIAGGSSPSTPAPQGPRVIEREENPLSLDSELRYNGLMEYKVIPWTNCSSEITEKAGRYRDLTLNLSLWMLCILAGNNCSLDWDYGPLEDEMLHPKRLSNGNAEEQEADDVEITTEPSQSTMSSFAFSNPALSFSASQFSQPLKEISVSDPLPPVIRARRPKLLSTALTKWRWGCSQPPSYVLDNHRRDPDLPEPSAIPKRRSAAHKSLAQSGTERQAKRKKRVGEMAIAVDVAAEVESSAMKSGYIEHSKRRKK
jgi:hypothetical protein